MNLQTVPKPYKTKRTTNNNRSLLLENLPVTESRYHCAGISTAVLEGGAGSPVVLLHGPGESALWWMRVFPILLKTNRVIAPDLPGHGASAIGGDKLDTDLVLPWLSELIEKTCSSAPALAGNIIGGSIAARFAIDHGEQLSQLVLVNSLGLATFRPSPGFAFGLIRFMIWPTEKNFDRFFPQCIYNVEDLQIQMGEKWEPFVNYNLESARDKERSAALQALMKKVGVPKIPYEKLAKINVPTALIWGRHDKANKLKIAKAARKKYGWPLYIIEETRDDPKLERPAEFTDALCNILSDT